MSEFFSMLPFWFYILLAIGVWDAFLQWLEYREWRKAQSDTEGVNE